MSPSRILAALTPLLALALVVPAEPAGATNASVSVDDFAFTPAVVTVGMGQTVTWTFHATHTSTSNQGFWNSGTRSSGTYVATFRDAGTFGYHCAIHPMMMGRVRVPLTWRRTVAGGVRLRWSVRTSTPANRRFDVQYRRAGTSIWHTFRSATSARSGVFDPTRHGSYVVRARVRNVGVGASGWSPLLTVRTF